MTIAEWESAILSAHATRSWPLDGSRANIADELHDWIADELGGTVGHETTEDVIEMLACRDDSVLTSGAGGARLVPWRTRR